MVLYHWARCSTCRQAREELARHELEVTEHDIFAEPLQRTELEALIDRAGVRKLTSTASPSFRDQGRTLEEWTDEELMQGMLADSRLVKRPLLVGDDGSVLIGLPAIRRSLAG